MAADIFAKLGDIKGESRDAKHKDEIEVLSWSWGVSNSTTATGGGSGGGGAGKATFQDLLLTHAFDRASPSLMLACATGKHIPDATITQRKAGKGQQEYLIVKLNDVIITSVGDSSSGDVPSEHVSISFAKIHVEYKPQKDDGSFDTSVHFKYDVKTNKTF
jgi:type VI secretion system secreted protein Hcp